ncbi:hypothetical protein FA95DRAFT_1032121 [Auriscalpium vulgare]|uniref:Uncharacterized protein n=1 Tax=Auriscalpium vulgare TaxID=40419 RepID=A0ACB8RXH3_9AGAM|nr:hypothetical protein FA95DRAFT_1032121 [Auriscalpium vulgare]
MNEEQVKDARDLCAITHAVLELLGNVFTVPAILRVFTNGQLRCMLTQDLAIPLAHSLPTSNAHKTCALAIWALQTQRLPAAVLAPVLEPIAYVLLRAIYGELSKESKKGSGANGHRAIHYIAPALVVPPFEQLLPSMLAIQIGPTLNMRGMAVHALSGLRARVAEGRRFLHAGVARGRRR